MLLVCKSKKDALKLPVSFIEEFCDHIRIAWNEEIICTNKIEYDRCRGMSFIKTKELLDRNSTFRREVIKYILTNFKDDVTKMREEVQSI